MKIVFWWTKDPDLFFLSGKKTGSGLAETTTPAENFLIMSLCDSFPVEGDWLNYSESSGREDENSIKNV